MPSSTRKDARRSHRAILAAARELYAGAAEVSFAEIAHGAGVGQATVYRHFADRQELLMALAEETLGHLEEELAADPGRSRSFEEVLRMVVAEQVRGQGLVDAIRRGEISEERVRGISARVLELFQPSVEAAREAGALRTEIELEDVELVLAMVDGALAQITDPAERGRVAERAVGLALQGLEARP